METAIQNHSNDNKVDEKSNFFWGKKVIKILFSWLWPFGICFFLMQKNTPCGFDWASLWGRGTPVRRRMLIVPLITKLLYKKLSELTAQVCTNIFRTGVLSSVLKDAELAFMLKGKRSYSPTSFLKWLGENRMRRLWKYAKGNGSMRNNPHRFRKIKFVLIATDKIHIQYLYEHQ